MEGNFLSRSRLLKVVLASLVSLSGFAQKGAGTSIVFDSSVMPFDRQLILGDIRVLKDLRPDNFVFDDLQGRSQDLQDLKINPRKWLLDRVSIIVGPLNRPVAFNSSTNSIMRNLGAILANERNHTLQLNSQFISVTSSAMGVIQYAKNPSEILFTPNSVPYSIMNQIYRLTLLFHVARHSDGKSGIPQVKCPSGSPYGNLPVCDQYVDGALGVETLVAQALLNYYKAQLNDQDRLRFTNWIALQKARIIGKEIYAH